MKAVADRASLAGRRWPVAFLLLATPVVVGLASLIAGQTVNWDLLNYHLYNPHALVTDRAAIDIAPAQGQSFYNPLLHIPYYIGFQILDHRLFAFLMGVLQGLLIFPLYRLARCLVGDHLSRRGTFYVAILGLLGPIGISELGTGFGDSLLAILFVMALVLLLRRRGEPNRALLAGLLGGAAAGLKLGMVFYLPGLVLAAMVVESERQPWVSALYLMGGLMAGFLACAGWWMLVLNDQFGSPVFPLFNDLFQSPWASQQGHRELRFLPDGFLQAVFKPLWAAVDYTSALELKFRGPRVVALFLSLLVLPLVIRRVRLPRPTLALGVFCAASFLCWSFLFGYYRYLAVIEVLAPVGLAALWYRWGKGRPRARNVIPILLVLTQLGVKVPNWGRGEYGSLELPVAASRDSAIVIAGSAPVGWLALDLPADVPMIRIAGNASSVQDGTAMTRKARQLIEHHDGPLLTLVLEDEFKRVSTELRAVGLYLDRLHCQPLQEVPYESLASRFWQCPVTRFNLGITVPEES